MGKRIEISAKVDGKLKNVILDCDVSGGVFTPNKVGPVASSELISWATYTPTVTLVGGAGNTTPVYTTNTGRYARVGKTVFVSVNLAGDGGAEGAGSGQINIALPVAIAAQVGSPLILVGRMTNNTTLSLVLGTLTAAASVLPLVYKAAIGTESNVTGAEQNNATRSIQLHFCYEAD